MVGRERLRGIGCLGGILVAVCLAVFSCAHPAENQINIWGYPRLISREEAAALLSVVQLSIQQDGKADCKPAREFDRDDELASMLLAATSADIVDYGQFPRARYAQAVEMIMKGPDWPETGVSLVVYLQDKKCAAYALSIARLAEGQ
jgi:hypothetical protein